MVHALRELSWLVHDRLDVVRVDAHLHGTSLVQHHLQNLGLRIEAEHGPGAIGRLHERRDPLHARRDFARAITKVAATDVRDHDADKKNNILKIVVFYSTFIIFT